jgi:hypothetical protein
MTTQKPQKFSGVGNENPKYQAGCAAGDSLVADFVFQCEVDNCKSNCA